VVVAAALVALASSLVAQAGAGTQSVLRVSGTYQLVEVAGLDCSPIDDARLACTVTGARSIYPTGQFDGESVADFRSVIDCAKGRTYAVGSETFTGSIAGSPSGTMTWQFVLAADFDCVTFAPTNIHLVGIVTGATGGLSGTRGVVQFGDTTYTGVLHR
jgi:hypothetical protein